MGTIAEALVATAVGLVVAIPAVAVFNYFQGRVTAALADAETLGHVLLAHLRAEHDPELATKRAVRGHSEEDASASVAQAGVPEPAAE
jgi:biopolymer transport protein ExbB